MPSRTIRPTQAPEPAPFAYTIGTADGLTPEAVFAQWDGTGTGSDFLPCVSYYSAEGVLLDRAFPTTGPVAAGGTAEVSYRPFERGGGGTAATPLATTDGAVTVNPTTELLFDPPATVTDLGGGIARIDITPVMPALIYAQGLIPGAGWPGVEFPLPFSPGPSHGVTVTANSWKIQTAGVYQLSLHGDLARDGPMTPPAGIGMFWDISGATDGSGWGFPGSIAAGDTWRIAPTLVKQVTLPANAVIRFGVSHVDGVGGVYSLFMSLVRLGA